MGKGARIRRRAARAARGLLLSIAVVAATAIPAPAAPGDLDPSFGGDGKVTTKVRDWLSYATDVAIQQDGKIVAAGWATGRFGLVRYETDGGLDPTFSGDGRVTTDFTRGLDWANGVAIQPDGKIVAVGSAGFNRFAAARYRPNGTLDPSFGDDGRVTTNFNGGTFEEVAEDVAIQADGRIVVAGFAEFSTYRFALARYHADGRLDRSFGHDGRVKTGFARHGGDMAQAIAIQPDGKIVAVGSSVGFALARYNPDGTKDTTFGGDGKVTTRIGRPLESANAVALQPDGKIVVAGETDAPFRVISSPGETRDTSGRFALARYRPGGRLDPTFGSDGTVTTNFTRQIDRAHGVAIQPDGKIVAAGVAADADRRRFDSRFALARYDADGRRDFTFGADGKITTNFADSLDAAHAVVLQDDGRIVAAGRAAISGRNRFALARYLTA